ncbi:MAG: hypothetical protein ACJA0S_001096 [Rickettsiales bacterium]|jgi:hypothetical protein
MNQELRADIFPHEVPDPRFSKAEKLPKKLYVRYDGEFVMVTNGGNSWW